MTKQQEKSKTAQVTLMNVITKFYEKGMLKDEDLAELSNVDVKED